MIFKGADIIPQNSDGSYPFTAPGDHMVAISEPRFEETVLGSIAMITGMNGTGSVADFPVVVLTDDIQTRVFENLRIVRGDTRGTVLSGSRRVSSHRWLPVVWDGALSLEMVYHQSIRPVNVPGVSDPAHNPGCHINCTCPAVVFGDTTDTEHAFGCPSATGPCREGCVPAAPRLKDFQAWEPGPSKSHR